MWGIFKSKPKLPVVKNYSHLEINRKFLLTKYSPDVVLKIVNLQYWSGMSEEQLDDMLLYRYTTLHYTPNYLNNSLLMNDPKFLSFYKNQFRFNGYYEENKMYKNGDIGLIKIYGGSKNSGNYFTFINGILKTATVKYDYKFPS
jgi:hypothetical protein